MADEPKVQKTPQGQFVTEAPETTAPSVKHNLFGYGWGTWLGNPNERYGYLVSSLNVPINIKLEMLCDEVIALCMAFTGATLVKARREIQCADEKKQRFFDALFRQWEQEFILQANVGIALGSLGLVKQWRFATPQPVAVDDPPVWTGAATPYIITGFEMLYPTSSTPKFDDKGRHFQGMDTQDGPLDVFYSLWLTFRQELAFGAYGGVGRLEHCYKQWWLKNFGTDLYVVALQKQANRVVQASYPPGVDPKSGKSNQTIALEVGDSVRSGATVAIPSDTYTTIGLDGEERASTVQKWGLEFLEGAGSMQAFHEIDDHHDKKMAMGYFIPPQSLFDVTGGQLGSVTSAEVLAGIAAEILMQDAADIDRHLNEYVFPAISTANFPDTSPRVTVRTTGLAQDSRAALTEMLKALIGQHPDAQYFDLRAAMERLEFPLKSEEQVAQEQAEAKKAEEQKAAAAAEKQQAAMELLKQQQGGQPEGDMNENPPAKPEPPVQADITDEGKVVVAGNPLQPWPDKDVPVDEKDAAAAVLWWRDFAPAGFKGLLDAASAEGLNAYDDNDIDLGGPGSGNWAHVGRKGQVGGSATRETGMTVAKGKDWLDRYEKAAGKPHPLAVEIANAKKGSKAERLKEIQDEIISIEQRIVNIAAERLDLKKQYADRKINVLQYQKAAAELKREEEDLEKLHTDLTAELNKISAEPELKPEPEPEPEPKPLTAQQQAAAIRQQLLAPDKREAEVAGIKAKLDGLQPALQQVENELTAIKAKYGWSYAKFKDDPEYAAINARRSKIYDEINVLYKEREVLTQAITADARQLLRVENPIQVEVRYKSSFKGDARAEAVARGLAEFRNMVSSQPDREQYVTFRKAGKGRASAEVNTPTINVTTSSGVSTIIHELGHWLENQNSFIQQQVYAFYDKRTQGEKTISMNTAIKQQNPGAYGGYASNERTRVDKFIHPYMGKDYVKGGGKRYATELLSMGLQMFYDDPRKLAREDPDYFDFIFAVVRGQTL